MANLLKQPKFREAAQTVSEQGARYNAILMLRLFDMQSCLSRLAGVFYFIYIQTGR